jgi:hypothetical protein
MVMDSAGLSLLMVDGFFLFPLMSFVSSPRVHCAAARRTCVRRPDEYRLGTWYDICHAVTVNTTTKKKKKTSTVNVRLVNKE